MTDKSPLSPVMTSTIAKILDKYQIDWWLVLGTIAVFGGSETILGQQRFVMAVTETERRTQRSGIGHIQVYKPQGSTMNFSRMLSTIKSRYSDSKNPALAQAEELKNLKIPSFMLVTPQGQEYVVHVTSTSVTFDQLSALCGVFNR